MLNVLRDLHDGRTCPPRIACELPRLGALTDLARRLRVREQPPQQSNPSVGRGHGGARADRQAPRAAGRRGSTRAQGHAARLPTPRGGVGCRSFARWEPAACSLTTWASGKTLQTIAHLVIEKCAGRLSHPALVVAPTSLASNWVREIDKFAPQLRTVLYHGARRKKARPPA